MIDERVAPNFWLSELLHSDKAVRLGLDNTPSPAALANLRQVTGPGIQRVRDLLRVPVIISSGYRSPAVNKAVGSGPSSQHLTGQATDFIAPDFGPPLVICRKLLQHADMLRYDQLIYEGTWVHISFTMTPPRKQVLTAKFSGGKVSYLTGLVA